MSNNSSEEISFDGRKIILTWRSEYSVPQGKRISQVTGYCFDKLGRVVIVKNKRGWNFPGGHPEGNESPEQTLNREIWEEAAIKISKHHLIGYVEAIDSENIGPEGKEYLQLKFVCLISEVGKMIGDFETSDRKFVAVNDLPIYIDWLRESATGRAQYNAIIRESRFYI